MVGPLGLGRSIGLVSWPDGPGYQNEWPFGPEQKEMQATPPHPTKLILDRSCGSCTRNPAESCKFRRFEDSMKLSDVFCDWMAHWSQNYSQSTCGVDPVEQGKSHLKESFT